MQDKERQRYRIRVSVEIVEDTAGTEYTFSDILRDQNEAIVVFNDRLAVDQKARSLIDRMKAAMKAEELTGG